MKSAHAGVLGWSAGIVAAVSIAGAVAVRAFLPGVTSPIVPSAASSTGDAPSAPASARAEEPGRAAELAATAAATTPPEPPPATEQAPPSATRCAPEPPLAATRAAELPPPAELLRLVNEAPQALGSASIGSPTRGSLWGGIEINESEGLVHAGGYRWGTERVVRSIERAVREVRRCYPGSPRLYVGDIARERGGWLRPHRSHQSGLDADIGYYYRTASIWYQRATAENLDAPRTWTLIRALLEGNNVEMIFIDLSVQRLLQAYLATLPERERPPADLFWSPRRKDTTIRHAWGHATHFHVRFTDPAAVELGKRLERLLPRRPAPRRAKPAPHRGGRLSAPAHPSGL